MEDDPAPVSLLDYFIREFEIDTPFVRAFLHGRNLLRIQDLLTESLRARIGLDTIPKVGFSDAIISHLMQFATVYKMAWATDELVARANQVFADQFADQNEGRYYETAFWKRWCSQGLPDPNNIPLPLQGDRPDFTAETDGYVLNNPIGYKVYPRW
jgi:hypothetical protein